MRTQKQQEANDGGRDHQGLSPGTAELIQREPQHDECGDDGDWSQAKPCGAESSHFLAGMLRYSTAMPANAFTPVGSAASSTKNSGE